MKKNDEDVLKDISIKIKAKCKECKRRLFTNSVKGVHCKNGDHKISTPLTYQTARSTNPGPKWRRKGSKGSGKTSE